MSKMRYPSALRRGDVIAIVAPATEVKREYVEGAAGRLRSLGYEVVVAPHCLDSVSGTYASTASERLEDFLAAYSDPRVRCVLCARGGYGCVHLISDVPGAVLTADPKWVVGFSDVSALHSLMLSHGVASLHAGMAKHIFESSADDFSVDAFLRILGGEERMEYELSASDGVNVLNAGEASGMLRGGNFAVLNGLASTRFDILDIKGDEKVILFLEDVGEGIYEVDRMLWRLHLSGALHRAEALLFGSFSSYRPDKNHPTMEQMIEQRMREWGITVPVVTRFPFGHEDGRNLPMVEGCEAHLVCGNDGSVRLIQEMR